MYVNTILHSALTFVLLKQDFCASVVVEVVSLLVFLLAVPAVANLTLTNNKTMYTLVLVLLLSPTPLHSCSILLFHFPMPVDQMYFIQ